MLITLARITNYKRIRDVEIRPSADSHLVLIGGSNAQGKTSVLDALDAAIGGRARVADDPVLHGAPQAAITIEYDGGALVVERNIDPDGHTTLTVTGKDGTIRSPQTMLDQLLGARFIDPLAFLRLDPKDQRAALLKLIDTKGELRDLEVRRERIFEKRTEVGRDLKKAEGELARLPPVPEAAGSPIDVAALARERAEFSDLQRAGDALGVQRDSKRRIVATATSTVERIRARTVELQAELEKLHKDLPAVLETEVVSQRELAAVEKAIEDAAAAWSALQARRDEVDAQLANANAHNAKVNYNENAANRRSDAVDAVDKLVALRSKQTDMLDKIDAQKSAFLAAAELPIDGLGFDLDGVTFGGVPLVQASGAERLRVAVSLAMASASELDDILVRDAALLDDDMLALVGELAAAANKRVWLERVGTRDPDVIVIHDGMVAE